MSENITEKKKILIVDDDEIHLLTAELFLKADYEVLKMKSGSDVLEYLSSNEYVPDLVLLDIVMPGMDGWQVLKKLKTMDKIKDIPVVFLSVIKSEEEKKKAFNLGITDFIHKPFNMADLKSRINDIIAKNDKKNKYSQPESHYHHFHH